MNIAGSLLEEIVGHALENPKIECCGLVAVEPFVDGDRTTATRVYRAVNVHATALKFAIDPEEQFKINREIEEAGWEIGGIYHSHVRSAPKPSQTDINYAAHMGPIEWIIVGLAGDEPEVRSWLIDGAEVKEVSLTEPSS